MNTWNKVLLSFILVVSLAFLYLAVKDLKLHRTWGAQAKKLQGTDQEPGEIELEIRRQKDLFNGVLSEGEVVEPGVRQLTIELNRLTLQRGRAWFNCQALKLDQTGIQVQTALPNPNGITPKTILYVFEQKDPAQGGSFLGQFSVAGVAEERQMVQLQPSRRLAPEEMQRLIASQKDNVPWALYETLPVDFPAAFAGLTEEQKNALPAHVIDAYSDESYEPKDFEILLREAHQRRSQIADMAAAAARDKQYMDAAIADSKLQEQSRRKEIDDLTAELAAIHREAEAVIAHRDSLKAKVDGARAAIQETIQKNIEMVGEIAKRQTEGKPENDGKVRQVARVGGR